ncbi:MAG: hypothetical protein K1X79_02370 [Oligoflexia bacterium]|nr:hypothetical protein [Oligoflexia bacterium]
MTFSYRPIVIFLMCVVLGLAIGCGGGTMGTQTGERLFDGTVLDDNGQPQPGIEVSIKDPQTGEPVATVVTGDDGSFSASAEIESDSVVLEFTNPTSGVTGEASLDLTGENQVSVTAVIKQKSGEAIYDVVLNVSFPTPSPTVAPTSTAGGGGPQATATPTPVSTAIPSTSPTSAPTVVTTASPTPTQAVCTSDCDATDPTPTPQPTAAVAE